MKKKTPWWEHLITVLITGVLLTFALWTHYYSASRKSSGFIPSGYDEQDVDDVRLAAKTVLDCWLVQEGAGCFSDGFDTESPFLWDLLDDFNGVLAYHQAGQSYEVDTKALGMLMNMDWPKEERHDFANSRDFRKDGMAIVFVTGSDLEFLEPCWQARLCDGCVLPYLKQRKMAEVRTVIKSAHGPPGTSIVLYLRATETGWLLFDWQAS